MGPSSFNDGNMIPWTQPVKLPWGFNGAVVFQRRKLALSGYGQSLSSGFNGAVVFQRRKLDDIGTGCRRNRGFNGAVVFQRRKLDSFKAETGLKDGLQWGRRLSTTETSCSNGN